MSSCDLAQRRHAGVLRMHAPPHRLDDDERRQVVEIRLAAAGRSGGADAVPHVQPGAEDRRIADAARHLPRQPARRRHAADLAARTDGVAVDRAPEMIRVDQPFARHLVADGVADLERGAAGRRQCARVDAPLPLEPQRARLSASSDRRERRSRARARTACAPCPRAGDAACLEQHAVRDRARPCATPSSAATPPARRAARACSRRRAARRRRRSAGRRIRRSCRPGSSSTIVTPSTSARATSAPRRSSAETRARRTFRCRRSGTDGRLPTRSTTRRCIGPCNLWTETVDGESRALTLVSSGDYDRSVLPMTVPSDTFRSPPSATRPRPSTRRRSARRWSASSCRATPDRRPPSCISSSKCCSRSDRSRSAARTTPSASSRRDELQRRRLDRQRRQRRAGRRVRRAASRRALLGDGDGHGARHQAPRHRAARRVDRPRDLRRVLADGRIARAPIG